MITMCAASGPSMTDNQQPPPPRRLGRPPDRGVRRTARVEGRTTPELAEKIRRNGGWPWVERLIENAQES